MVDLDAIIRDPGFEGIFIGPHRKEGGVFVSLMHRDRRRDLQLRRDTLAECLSALAPKEEITLNLDDI